MALNPEPPKSQLGQESQEKSMESSGPLACPDEAIVLLSQAANFHRDENEPGQFSSQDSEVEKEVNLDEIKLTQVEEDPGLWVQVKILSNYEVDF